MGDELTLAILLEGELTLLVVRLVLSTSAVLSSLFWLLVFHDQPSASASIASGIINTIIIIANVRRVYVSSNSKEGAGLLAGRATKQGEGWFCRREEIYLFFPLFFLRLRY